MIALDWVCDIKKFSTLNETNFVLLFFNSSFSLTNFLFDVDGFIDIVLRFYINIINFASNLCRLLLK